MSETQNRDYEIVLRGFDESEASAFASALEEESPIRTDVISIRTGDKE